MEEHKQAFVPNTRLYWSQNWDNSWSRAMFVDSLPSNGAIVNRSPAKQ